MPRRFIGVASETIYDGPEMTRGGERGPQARSRPAAVGSLHPAGAVCSFVTDQCGDGRPAFLRPFVDGAKTSI